MSPTKPDTILEAALDRFIRYGFRRTSMQDIAEAANVSRPALYQEFKNKEAIFRALSLQIHDDALRRAGAAFGSERPVSDRILSGFEAWSLDLVELADSWPHGGELVDTNGRIGADIVKDAQDRFLAMLAGVLRSAARRGELDLKSMGLSARRAAEFLLASSQGLKERHEGCKSYRRRIAEMVKIFSAAARPRDETV